MSCKEFKNREEELADYAEATASPDVARKLETHLAGCGECRKAVDEARRAGLLLRAGWEAAPVPGNEFWFRVRAGILAEEKRAGFWLPLETWAFRFSFSAALGLALLTGYALTNEFDGDLGSGPVAESLEPEQQPRSGDDVLWELVRK